MDETTMNNLLQLLMTLQGIRRKAEKNEVIVLSIKDIQSFEALDSTSINVLNKIIKIIERELIADFKEEFEDEASEK